MNENNVIIITIGAIIAMVLIAIVGETYFG